MELNRLLKRIAVRFQKSVERRGLTETIRMCLSDLPVLVVRFSPFGQLRNSPASEFDRQHNVETSGLLDLWHFDIASPNYLYGIRHDPTPPEILRKMLYALPIRYQDFVFVDFGSGKGRALLVAAEFPFKRVIGVEFARELCAIAEANILNFRSRFRKCAEIKSVCMDAVEYPIPRNPAVFYFYNPFEREVMEPVLHNIQDSLERDPREAYLLYLDPMLDHLVQEYRFLVKIQTDKRYVIYASSLERGRVARAVSL